jgi:hypothetical protein
MTETLTESFCERCGTRYTFESAAPRAARLKGVKVLSRGFKNFVMSDDTSLDEAMAAARSETDREVTSQQLDAFHKTFNFCMECRQYTCGNCWNEADGRCLSCAPNLGHEILPSPFPDLDAHVDLRLDESSATNGANGASAVNGSASSAPEGDLAGLSWPSSDFLIDAETASDTPARADVTSTDGLSPVVDDPGADLPEPIDLEARLALLDQMSPTTSDTVEAAGVDAAPSSPPEMAEASTDRAAEADVSPSPVEAEPAVAPLELDPTTIDRAAAAAVQTNDLLQKFRPGQSLDAEIEAYEREQAALEASAAALMAAAATDRPGGDVPAQDGSADDLAPTEQEPEVAPAPRDDIVAQPTWQIVAPDVAGAPTPTPATPASQPTTTPPEPQWPAQPEWPSQRPAASVPFLARADEGAAGLDSLWAESAREVAATPAAPAAAVGRASNGVAPCVSCGLSLSATARFCRRCGTRQA